MIIVATPLEDDEAAVPAVPVLVRIRPNMWRIADLGTSRPLALTDAPGAPIGAEPIRRWTLLPDDMADMAETIRTSKNGLHAALRARHAMRVGARLRPGVHLLEHCDGTAWWMSRDPATVAAVTARLDELDRFGHRLARFQRLTGVRPAVLDDTRDGSRFILPGVTGDASGLPGRWEPVRTPGANVDWIAVDETAQALLDRFDPPGPADLPGLPVRAAIGLHDGVAVARTDAPQVGPAWTPVPKALWAKAERRARA